MIDKEEIERRERVAKSFQEWIGINGRTYEEERKRLGQGTMEVVFNAPERLGAERERKIREEMKNGIPPRETVEEAKAPGKAEPKMKKVQRPQSERTFKDVTERDIRRCRRCGEYMRDTQSCDYILNHGHRRGCRPGVQCTKFRKREEVQSLQSSVLGTKGTGEQNERKEKSP